MKKLLIGLMLISASLVYAIEHEVSVRPDPDHKGIYNVYVRHTDTETRELVLSSNTIIANHPHPAEYHQNTLYVLLRGKTGMELWQYSTEKKKLITAKFLSFRVADDNKYCVATDTRTMYIITKSGIQKIPMRKFLGASELDSATGLGLVKWSKDSKKLFGGVQTGIQTTSLWSFDRDTWRIERFPARALNIKGEYALNTDTLRLLYTTPAKPDKRKLSLSWYDLQKNSGGEVISANVSYFDPRWIDKNNIDFVPPSRKGRVLFNIQ